MFFIPTDILSSFFLNLDMSVPLLQIVTNATNGLLTGGDTTIPASQIVDTVANNSTTATAAIVGVGGTVATVIGKTILDRKSSYDNNAVISEMINRLIQDVEDNYKDFADYCDIEKRIQDYAQMNPALSMTQLYEYIYDVSTKETLGQKRARHLNNIMQYYQSYYNRSTSNALYNGKNQLKKTLEVVKDKTTPA